MSTLTTDIPRIYVVSLADYVDGELHGTWIDVADVDGMHAAIADMLASSPAAAATGERAEEYAIHDYDGFYGYRVEEFESIDHLAELMQVAEFNRDHYGMAVWATFAYAADTGDDPRNAAGGYYGEFGSRDEFDTAMVDSWVDYSGIDEALTCYLDTDAIARDMAYDFTICNGPNGSVAAFTL